MPQPRIWLLIWGHRVKDLLCACHAVCVTVEWCFGSDGVFIWGPLSPLCNSCRILLFTRLQEDIIRWCAAQACLTSNYLRCLQDVLMLWGWSYVHRSGCALTHVCKYVKCDYFSLASENEIEPIMCELCNGISSRPLQAVFHAKPPITWSNVAVCGYYNPLPWVIGQRKAIFWP